MKDTKKQIETYTPYALGRLEAHLEDMAARGWMPEKISGMFWTYRRIEPKKVHVTAIYFEKASLYAPGPTESQMTFREFCEHTGWKQAASYDKLHILYNEQEDPLPIETDPVTKVETIDRAMGKRYLPGLAFLVLVALLGIAQLCAAVWIDFVGELVRSSSVWSCLLWLDILVSALAELCVYVSWRRRARQAAEQGIFLPAKEHTLLSAANSCLIVLILAAEAGSLISIYGNAAAMGIGVFIAVAAALPILAAGRIREYLRRKAAGAKVNAAVTAAVFAVVYAALLAAIGMFIMRSGVGQTKGHVSENYEHDGISFTAYGDALPLTAADLTGREMPGRSTWWKVETSPLLARYTGQDKPRMDTTEETLLEYTVVEVKVPALYDRCRRALLGHWDETADKRIPEEYKKVYREQDPAPWQAKEAYVLYDRQTGEELSQYLICFADRIVEVDMSWEPSEEQMKIITEKLLAVQ